MRIRKHAKISPLIYAGSTVNVLQPHVCQLNQSPWDVMSFSPPSTPPPSSPPLPPFQVDGDDASAGNGSSPHCVSVAGREFNNNKPPQREYSDDFSSGTTAAAAAAHEMDESKPMKTEKTIFCVKTDGKSWQCRREAAKGNSLCKHHLSLAKSYFNLSSQHHLKKPEKPSTTIEQPQRRPRPKKNSTSSSSNPYEFYYYSGFGPRWGKKRGETCRNNDTSMPRKNGRDQEHEIEIEDQYFDYNYSEYEDELDDEENRDHTGSKKKRKPIKARSLKSLM